MVIKKIILATSILFIIVTRTVFSSQILDYETERFINSIISEISLTNEIEKKVRFKVLSDEEINAFVTEENIIYITSGLIQYSPDYVALISVIAHELGHIDKNHIRIRKKSIQNFDTLSKLSNLSIIAGSVMYGNPEILQGTIINSASLSNLIINFSKDQEREADYYSIKTLEKMDLFSDSIVDLLKIIEKKALDKGLNRELQRISTHPYFEDRIEILNFVENHDKNNFDENKNKKFNFIKAKFIGYSDNKDLISNLEEPYKTYARAITDSKNGQLNESLKKINYLLTNIEDNVFILETKADILFSYGYTDESVKFYKKVLKKLPKNSYAQIRIFENTDYNEISKQDSKKIFENNLNLLNTYYNNKNILNIYLKLAKNNMDEEWINFLNLWLNKDELNSNLIVELKKYSNTTDPNLKLLINKIISKYE